MPAISKTKKTPKKIRRYMLVDGNAIVHRGFHAIQHLSTKSGEPTNAVYGFTMILLRALSDIKPDFIAVTFDLPKPTFRHTAYKEYKAHRVKAPDELYAQIPRCKDIVRALGIEIFEKEGYEADDVLGTLARLIEEKNSVTPDFETLIVTGDLDTVQLVTDHTKVYTLRKGLTDVMVYDAAAVKERYGITVAQVVDFKAIKGDASDNIPGVTGIGEKGASELIQKFGSIENIYTHLDDLKPKQKALFEAQREQVEMSYQLSKIDCNVPEISPDLEHVHFSEENYRDTVKLFQELEFKSLITKLPKNFTATPNMEEKTFASAASAKKEKLGAFKQNYIFVNDAGAFAKLVADLVEQSEFAFDTETDGLGALDCDLVGIGFCWKEGEAYYVPATLLNTVDISALQAVFEDPAIAKVAHNIKYDFLALRRFGINVQNLAFDTMIASYLLSPGSRTHDLDTAVFNELGYQMQPITDLIGKGKEEIAVSAVDPEQMSWYCCEDTDFTLRLKGIYAPRLKSEKLEKIFSDIDMPLVRVLADIEDNGIKIDKKLFGSLEVEAAERIAKLEKEIYAFAGHPLNLNSPTQLKVVLFDELQLQPEAGVIRKKTKSGLSTAAGELEKMRSVHPIIAKILDYRELAKLQSTYIKTLPDLASKRDGRVHTSFNQTIAATGRLSSNNPNLQNIPVGSEGLASEIRKGFVAEKGKTLVSIDYSQIELRVVAHLADDPTMKRIFQSGEDIHSGTAMQIFNLKDPSQVTKEMRRDAKTINFGVLYGVSSFGLSERIESMSRADAAQFIKRYFEAFPKVDAFLKQIIATTHKTGYVANELGRKRYMPEINSSMHMVRAGAERAAINMPIQSLAADIMKIAMNDIAAKFDIRSKELKMILQVHDELVFEVDDDKVEKYAPQLHAIMESAYKLTVPLVAETKVGQSWGDMKPFVE